MQDVTLVHWGEKRKRNSASDYVDEYIERKRLAKLGFWSPLGEMSAMRADIYLLIDGELDRLRAAEAKEARKKR